MAVRGQETKSKFLQLMFQDYYRANADRVDVPERLHMREFGMESWDFIWRCPERRTHDASGTENERGLWSVRAVLQEAQGLSELWLSGGPDD